MKGQAGGCLHTLLLVPPPPLHLFLLLLLFLHQVVLELSPSLGQEVGWSTNTSTRINAWTNCICMSVSNSRPMHTCCLILARNMCVYTQVVSMNPHTHTTGSGLELTRLLIKNLSFLLSGSIRTSSRILGFL